MTLEEAIPKFSVWIGEAILYLPLFIVFFATAGIVVGYLVSAIRRGPVEGFYAVAKVIGSAVLDLANKSVRRTFAMAMLTFQLPQLYLPDKRTIPCQTIQPAGTKKCIDTFTIGHR